MIPPVTTIIDNPKIMNEQRRKNALKMLDNVQSKKLQDENGRILVIQDINNKNRFAVLACNGGSYYEVTRSKNMGFMCNCYDYVNKCTFIEGLQCKHIQLIRILKEERKRKSLPKGVLKL